LFAGEAEDDDISPAVGINVVREGEEVLRVFVLVGECAFVAGNGLLGAVGLDRRGPGVVRVRVPLGKVGAFPPVRPVDDVHFSILVEVPEVGAFGPEMRSELFALPFAGERWGRSGLGEDCDGE
jgi:hypothetical protein